MTARLLALAMVLLTTAAHADTPALYLAAEEASLPGGEATVQVRARDDGGKADVHVFTVAKPLELLRALPDVRRLEIEGTEVRAAMDAALASKTTEPRFGLERARTFQTDVPSGYQTHPLRVETPKAGLYLVEVDLHGQAAYALVSATAMTTVVKRSEQESLVWVTDRKSGAPRANVGVVISDGGRPVATGKTGADGAWRGRVPYVPDVRIMALDDGDLCLGLSEHYPAATPTPKVYLTTERALYRPGETVFFKGIARVPTADGLVPPGPGAVTVRALDPLGATVAELTTALNGHGTFSGSFPLPVGVAAGAFRLVAEVGGGAYAGAFQVEDFRKPAFEVRVAALKRQVVGGDDVAVRIGASMYSGGALKGATVEWTALKSRFDRPSWLDVDKSGYLAGAREGAALKSEMVAQGTGTLNDKGELVIELHTEKSTEDLVYRFAAVVRGPDGQRVSGSGSAAVTAAAFRLAVRAEPLVVKADEAVTLTVGARDYADAPVAATVTVRALLLDTTLEPKGPAQGGDVVRELHREVVTTDAEGVATVRFTPGAGGHIQVVAEATDDRGNAIAAVTYLWASVGHEALSLKADGLQILPDRRIYEPGQTARVMIVSPEAGASLLVTEEGAALLGYRVVAAAGNAALIEIRLRSDHAPNVFISVASTAGGKVRVATRQLVVVPTHRTLAVEVKADKEVYRARETGRLTVTTRDATGTPVSAEVSIAVVDQALLALAPRMAPELLPFFAPRQRNGVGTDTSAATASYGYGVRAERLVVAVEKKPAFADKLEEMLDGGGGVGRGMAAPSAAMAESAAAPEPMADEEAKEDMAPGKKKAKGGKNGEEAADETREELVTTLLWEPHVMTGADGTATVNLRFSDDLTTWAVAAEAVTDDTKVGQAEAVVKTRQELLVRLDPPTSLTEGDAVTLRAVVQNLTDATVQARVTLEAEGAELHGDAEQTVEVGAQDAAAVAWPVVVRGPDALRLRVAAEAGERRDALRVEAHVRRWGAKGGERALLELGGDGADASVTLTLPKGALGDSAVVTVRLASGPAAAIRAALPWLADYPYGCVEQTMSRFVPLLAAKGVLERLGAVEGLPADADAMVRVGVSRLVAMQGDDGGWGWFGGGERDALMSAYALYGLALGRTLGAAVPDGVLERGAAVLRGVPDEGALPYATRVFALHALALADGADPTSETKAQAARLFDTLDRTKADAWTRAQLAVTLVRCGQVSEAVVLVKELAGMAKREGGRATWDGGGPFAGDRADATAWVLRALVTVDPKGADVVPALAGLMSLRTGERWESTRDTAAAVMALTDLLAAGAPGLEAARVTVSVAGKALPELSIDPTDLRGSDAVVEVREGLKPGPIVVAAEKSGRGLLVGEASLRYLVGGETIPADAAGLAVERRVSRLVAPAGGRGAYRLEPVRGAVKTGDVLQVELEVHPEAGQQYVLLEDPRPTGFERIRDERDYPIEGQSSGPVADHVERRTDRTAFFFARLDGTQTVRYLLRPELPGTVRLLPAAAEMMYRPAVQGRSGSLSLEVTP